MFSEDLIYLNESYHSQDDLFNQISKDLLEKEYVYDSYQEALKQREMKYPTGLQTEVCGIAIPHTDAIHIKKQAIAVVKLDKGIMFKEMVGDADVSVKLLFFLLVKEKESQVQVLSNLMGLFSNKQFVNALLQSESKIQILETINNEIKE
ncbi:PTS sugar transporter subunit IIA [Carnobacterium sp. ISL-102]|uniref:PTS sugar transporter subunit IIA n=1 Tax=Carnobacterium sp. ISL-102 TaxID=2819142 RepID=UPI001BE88B76|nr:PTS sugar transporter subunit IIA [Carnobacterium sp. ISL-102]MBT2732459.1 PTS sugar transporter subunit IIA [Carnobacterium sp. ISL-102]